MSQENMRIWDRFGETDPKHTKEVRRGGYQFTAIDAYYQIEQATSLWGPMGERWGLERISREILVCEASGEMLALYSASLFVQPSSPTERITIHTETAVPLWRHTPNGLKLDAEAPKKALTDMITKGLSYLGFGHDVFQGQFDGNRYVDGRGEAPRDSSASVSVTENLSTSNPVLGMPPTRPDNRGNDFNSKIGAYVLPDPEGEAEPDWFDQPHGKPGQSPIRDCLVQVPVEEMTWRQFSEGVLGGKRYSRLVWELESYTPTFKGGDPLEGDLLVRYIDRVSKTKATLRWIELQAKEGLEPSTETEYVEDEVPF